MNCSAAGRQTCNGTVFTVTRRLYMPLITPQTLAIRSLGYLEWRQRNLLRGDISVLDYDEFPKLCTPFYASQGDATVTRPLSATVDSLSHVVPSGQFDCRALFQLAGGCLSIVIMAFKNTAAFTRGRVNKYTNMSITYKLSFK